jgi:hypothetical protein
MAGLVSVSPVVTEQLFRAAALVCHGLVGLGQSHRDSDNPVLAETLQALSTQADEVLDLAGRLRFGDSVRALDIEGGLSE